MNYLMKTATMAGVLAMVLSGCGGSDKGNTETTNTPPPKSMIEKEEPVDPMMNKGIGPVTSVTLADEIDQGLADQGKEIYEAKCTACHKAEKRFIGPAPKGILTRRSPEWVMNMILNPEEMVIKDPIAKALLIEFNGAPMANQNLTEDETRAVLEYFRTI